VNDDDLAADRAALTDTVRRFALAEMAAR